MTPPLGAVLANVRYLAGWTCLTSLSLLMVNVGLGKVFGFAPTFMLTRLRQLGLGEELFWVGCIEVLAGILLIFPRTVFLGLLLTSTFWGGAIVAHLVANQSTLPALGLLVVAWVGAVCRHPTLLTLCYEGLPTVTTVAVAAPARKSAIEAPPGTDTGTQATTETTYDLRLKETADYPVSGPSSRRATRPVVAPEAAPAVTVGLAR